MTAQPSEPTRVLLACDWFVKYTAGLARGFNEIGCETLLLTRAQTRELPGAPGTVARYVRGVTDGGVEHRMLPGRVRDPQALRAVGRTRRRVARFAPDFVLVQESVLDDPRLLVAAGVRPGRYAVTFHDPTPHPGDPVPGVRRRAMERLLLRHAGLVFVHSEVDRVELRKAFDTKAAVAVVPHGTGTPDITPLRSAPELLFFGRILPYKGLDVLLAAMPAVWEAVPAARLVVAGAGHAGVHPALADDRVELRNHHVPEDEVPGLFQRCRCVVLPYTQASQSGVGSQAKVYGRPMVVTAAGGLPELVADGSGVVCAPGDPVALAAALVDVLTTPGRATHLAERAMEGGRRSDWPEIARMSLAAWHQEAGAPPPSAVDAHAGHDAD